MPWTKLVVFMTAIIGDLTLIACMTQAAPHAPRGAQDSVSQDRRQPDAQQQATSIAKASRLRKHRLALSEKRQYRDAIDVTNEERKIYLSLGDLEQYAQATKFIATQLENLNEFDASIEKYLESTEKYFEIGKVQNAARCLVRATEFTMKTRCCHVLTTSGLNRIQRLARNDSDRETITTILEAQGKSCIAQQRFADAIEYLHVAKTMRPTGAPGLAGSIYYNLAIACGEMNFTRESEQESFVASKIFKKTGDTNAEFMALYLSAFQSIEMQEVDKAKSKVGRLKKLPDTDKYPKSAQIIAIDGWLAYRQHRHNEATRLFKDAIALNKKHGNEKAATLNMIRLSQSLIAEDKNEEAIKILSNAINHIAEEEDLSTLYYAHRVIMRPLLHTGKHDRALLSIALMLTYTEYFQKINITNKRPETSLRYQFTEYLTVESIAESYFDTNTDISTERKKLLRHALFLSTQILSNRAVLDRLHVHNPSSTNDYTHGQLWARNAMIEGSKEKANYSRRAQNILTNLERMTEIAFQRRTSDANPTRNPHGPGITQRTRDLLPHNSAIVEFHCGEKVTWAITITKKTGLSTILISNNTEKTNRIKAAAATFRDEVSSNAPPRSADQILQKDLLEPIFSTWEENGESIKNLAIACNGYAAAIPFEAILTTRDSCRPEGGGPYAITRIPSTSYFTMLNDPEGKSDRGGRKYYVDFYALGFPQDTEFEKEYFGYTSKHVDEDDDIDARQRLRRNELIEGTYEEILQIADLFTEDESDEDKIDTARDIIVNDPLTNNLSVQFIKGNRFAIALRASATEFRFKRGAGIGLSRIVHFAGHGESIPSKHTARLIFTQSPAIKSLSGEDGFLYLHELRDMQLTAELLTLSACETNDGRTGRANSIHSLAWAGLMAGARSVLSTMWRVDDEEARDLVVDFYRRWIKDGKSRIRALAEAKRAAIQRGAKMRNWAAYVLWDAEVGD